MSNPLEKHITKNGGSTTASQSVGQSSSQSVSAEFRKRRIVERQMKVVGLVECFFVRHNKDNCKSNIPEGSTEFCRVEESLDT